MNNNDMKEFMKLQIQEILKHKWIESEKAKRDLGDEAVKDWIIHYAKIFRKEWNDKQKNHIVKK